MKRIVITGGSGGLGRAVAQRFRTAGWLVDAPGRSELDVTDAAAMADYFADRTVDLLVCAAGTIHDAPLLRQPEDIPDEIIAVNFSGAAACAKSVVPGMIARGGGHIVFVSSHSALRPPPGQAAYATAKAALLGLASSLAASLGPRGIRVNTILPGFMETPMTAGVSGRRRQAVLADHALGRFNTPETVAGFIHFLHEHLPHTSGQAFQLDSRPGAF